MPDWAPELRRRLRALDLSPSREAEIVEELCVHLDERYRELIALGASSADASQTAADELAGARQLAPRLAQLRTRPGPTPSPLALSSSTSDRWYMRSIGSIGQDIVYALRRLRAAPTFALTALTTLAIGIGASTIVFSLVHGVLLQPLPFPQPDDLYQVYSANRAADSLRAPVSAVDLDDWRAQRRDIEDLGGYFYAEGSSGIDLTGRGEPRRLSAVFFTPGFLGALGVQPAAGRLPREDELVRGGRDTIVMLTHSFWMQEFGGDRSVLGSALTLNGRPYEVIGVLPAHMRVPDGAIEVLVPYSTIPDSSIPRLRQVRVLSVVARARPGVSAEGVDAEMQAITTRLAAQYPEDRSWGAATVVPLTLVITAPVENGLLVLLGAVGFLLLMTCANVTHLQLARLASRGREIAVRLALGAGRGRLAQLLLVESVVVSVLGGILGVALATVGLRALLALSAGQLPRASEISLNATVVLFAVGLSLLVGVVVGLAPVARAFDSGLAGVLRDSRGASRRGQTRGRRALVVAEVAIAIVLVVGAGLMSRSFVALSNVETGFKPDHLLAVQFNIDTARHSQPHADPNPPRLTSARYLGYYTEVIDAVRRLPGVVSAAAVKDPPFRGNGERNGFRIQGVPVVPGQDSPTATAIHVSDGYFETIGARVDGREFARTDRATAPAVVIVNEAFARRHFPGERAVGRSIQFGSTAVEIIGVVGDIRQVAMAEPAAPTMYLHNLQNSRSKTTIVVRTENDPLSMADTVRQTIWSIDKDQPITAVFTFDDAVARAMARPRLLTTILGSIGLIGLALGAIGLYGVLAALVGERRREIGVRLALGAEPRRVMAMVLRGGTTLAAVGVALGLVAAFGLMQFLTTVLYGVVPGDPLTFAGTAAIFILTSIAASWLPARRAARVDPMETLRSE